MTSNYVFRGCENTLRHIEHWRNPVSPWGKFQSLILQQSLCIIFESTSSAESRWTEVILEHDRMKLSNLSKAQHKEAKWIATIKMHHNGLSHPLLLPWKLTDIFINVTIYIILGGPLLLVVFMGNYTTSTMCTSALRREELVEKREKNQHRVI